MTTSSPVEEGTITEDAIARLRSRIGITIPRNTQGWQMASTDAMIAYARGIGDPNPLYRDAEYGASTRWRGVIGHPTLLRYMGDGSGTVKDEPVERPAGGDPLAGVHGFFGGVEMEFYRPLCTGDILTMRTGLADVQAKQSSMGGRAVHEIYDKVWWDRDGELVGVSRDRHIRIERSKARSRGKHEHLEVPHSYSDDDLAAVESAYESEEIRGSTPRLWDEVEVGDETAPLVKGPYTVTSFIMHIAGSGALLRNDMLFVHAEAHRYRKRHPKAFPRNELGIPDGIISVHWELDRAREAGVPERYDAGSERIAAMSQAVTNWMGDDGFLRRLSVRLGGFVFVGDLVQIRGTVVARSVGPDGPDVRLELRGTNQRGDEVVSGHADVLLPSREGGTVCMPRQPSHPVSPFDHRPEVD